MSVTHNTQSIVKDGLVCFFDASFPNIFTLSEIQVLVVAGGGGGGQDFAGGGGAGGIIFKSSHLVTPGSAITVTVGNGGPRGNTANGGGTAFNGQNSVFGSLVAIGGGGGGGSASGNASNGGSGGGCGYVSSGGYIAGTGTIGQGFSGESTNLVPAGGGGAGGPGCKGNGGPGLSFSISGTDTYYGGGGGGASQTANGMGGIGGGGSTTGFQAASNNGLPNTGGGGGGYYGSWNGGGDGGSGIVIVRYPGPQKATGGNTITNVGGYTIHTFTTSGTFTPSAAPANGGAVYGLQDLSGNNNTGTQSGGVTYSSANGGSIVFDGTNDYITIPDSNILDITTAISLETWIYATKSSGTQNVISKSSSTANNSYIYPRTNDGWTNVVFYLNAGGWSILSTAWPSRNAWHHTIATYDGSFMRIYINGSLANSKSQSGAISTNSNPLTIGDQPTYSEYYGGGISNTKIYNRALSATEISQNFNATKGRFGL